MKLSKNLRLIIVFAVIVALVVMGYIAGRDANLSKTFKDTLQKYFEKNNEHISSHDFKISNVVIRCRGNEAYLIEFNLSFKDEEQNGLDKLGATMYKKDGKWQVKGFGSGLSSVELKSYNFKCKY